MKGSPVQVRASALKSEAICDGRPHLGVVKEKGPPFSILTEVEAVSYRPRTNRFSAKRAQFLLVGLLPVIALVALMGAESAFACKCKPPVASELLPQSDAAVVGRLVAVTPHGRTAEYRYRVRFVAKAPRGVERGQLLIVRSARDEAACGLPPELGQSYGLFLFRTSGHWSSNGCLVVSPEELREGGHSRALMEARSGCV